MAVAAQNTNNTTIKSILQQEKSIGPKFTNWYRNLRIVLRSEGKLAHLEQPLIPLPYPVASQATRDAYNALYDAQNEVACLMLGSMSPELQRAKQELFEIVKAFHACKQEEGQSLSSYLFKMKSYLDTLECLGYVMLNELGVSLILNSLNKDYDQYSKEAEIPAMLAIREGNIQDDKKKPRGVKGKDKGKNKLPYAAKPKIPPRLREIIRQSTLSATTTRRWVIGGEIGLRESRKLKHGALRLYMGNGMRVVIEAIGSFDLILPIGLIIVLDNCHFAPSIARGVVSIFCLVNNSYIHTFTNYGISVSKDNVFYFNAIPRDGIYKIDMRNLYLNFSSMFNVSNKRTKHALDSSYLWHCRLGHINKKRMDKLQRDGILQPTHDESLEKYKSCISGKMARKPFPHQVERAKDLLGLIHTDVCGPFRIVSREGASYFITFTYDFSRYGYVYLMKHKHEVFETFKVFQNEVENQLGKKIKAIRSDRGGEYLTRILNMVPSKKVERTPYEIWHGKAPKLSYLRETIGYYFYYPLENKIFIARNAEFFENNLMAQEASGSHGLLESSGSDGGLELIQEEDTQPSENTSEIHNEVAPIDVEPQNVEVPIRRSTRIPQAPDRYGFYVDVEEY
ncbi:retrotransposon protein, putative, ty1-copia subclass [Tanacetum coccineum]